MTHFNYIEIGTSDFDTLCHTSPEPSNGISMDPLLFYLQRLPSKPGNIKVNAALIPEHMAKQGGEHRIYWINPSKIEFLQLPDWVRGCNSFDAPHPIVVELLEKHGQPLDFIQSHPCDVVTPQELWTRWQVESLDVLKLDTEGMDNSLVMSWLDGCNERDCLLPTVIWWECNKLSHRRQTRKVQERLTNLGYDLVHGNRKDRVMMRDVSKGFALLRNLGVQTRWMSRT